MRARRRIGTGWRFAPALAVALLPSGGASAETESVHIDYAAPADCPATPAFLHSLRARTIRFRQAGPEELARRFSVRVTASDSGFSGTVEIRGTDGTTAVRRVAAAICDEVANALALMTALAIDPNARISKVEPAPDRPAEPAAEPRAAPDIEQPTLRLMRPPAGPPPSLQPPSPPWRWSAGGQVQMIIKLTPALSYGGALFVEAEAPTSSTLGPALRMGLAFNQSDVEIATGGTARFRWAAAAVEGCPVRLSVLRWRSTLHPCLAWRLGILHGAGRGIRDPKQAWNLWSDAGLGLRLRIAATEQLSVEAQGQLVLPITRTTFEIQHDFGPQGVYSVPRLGVSAGIGAAYRFK